jgi:putative exosortase-associated protein (TIGR04073 family)
MRSFRLILVTTFLSLLLNLLFSPNEAAAYPGKKNLKQLQRGFADILFGIQEVPLGIYHYRDENPVIAVTIGFFDGLGRMITRELVGIVEIVTAPVYATKEPIYKYEW